MMIRKIISIAMFVIMSGLSANASAILIDRGGGLIYDTDLNITWFQDANYAKTSGYDADGLMNWGEATNWVTNLSYYDSVRHITWNDWRLPSALDQDGTGPCLGLYCYSSEMGYLYHVELGNNSGHLMNNGGPFLNLLLDVNAYTYWSGTEDIFNPDFAWDFGFFDGDQLHSSKENDYLFVWAVRNGDVVSVPEPQTLLLVGMGLVGLIVYRKRGRGLGSA